MNKILNRISIVFFILSIIATILFIIARLSYMNNIDSALTRFTSLTLSSVWMLGSLIIYLLTKE